MESRDTTGLSPPGAISTTPGPGSFGSLLQRTMSAAAPASTQTILPSPLTMRFNSGPISSVSLNPTHLTPPYLIGMPNVIAPHHIQVDMTGMDTSMGISGAETIKRKRGRPRKYGPDGSMALALCPLASPTTPVTSQKKRGRPPGSGKNQQLAALGGWLASSAGVGFIPHVLTIAAGEDVATKIMSFAQQGPRAVCLLSANGAISNVTLRQPAASGGTVTYEGRFEILSLLGSFLPADAGGGARGRTGGLSITLACADGRVIGGGVAGLLVAASPIQMVVGSFMYSEKKGRSRLALPEASSGEATPLMAIPLMHASVRDSDGEPEKMNGFVAKPGSPGSDSGTAAACDTHRSPQLQKVGAQYHLAGRAVPQAMAEARHTGMGVTLPAR